MQLLKYWSWEGKDILKVKTLWQKKKTTYLAFHTYVALVPFIKK